MLAVPSTMPTGLMDCSYACCSSWTCPSRELWSSSWWRLLKVVIALISQSVGLVLKRLLSCSAPMCIMIEFFFSNSRAFLPTFYTIVQMDLILPRRGLILPRIPPPTPVLYSAVTKPFLGYVCTRNTPQIAPLPGLNLKVSKSTWCLGNLDRQNVWKVGKKILEVGQKKLFICAFSATL